MDFDDIRLEDYDNRNKEWVKLCCSSSKGICELASRYRKRDDCWLCSMHSGSFNFGFRLHWDDGQEDRLIRFPLPGKSMFADEKIPREASLMRYVAKHTRIPIPRVIACGTAAESPTGLGPFLIMTWVEGKKMSDVLRKDDTDGKNDVLNPDLDKDTLMHLYGEMAKILLELWKLDFDAIGSLSTHDETPRPIGGHPLTLDMNESIRTCGLDDYTPNRTYYSSTDYISSLLQRQSTQLEGQRNSVYDSEDCRDIYTCRHLMKAVALHFISTKDDFGPFKLFCDDLCPGNVLVWMIRSV